MTKKIAFILLCISLFTLRGQALESYETGFQTEASMNMDSEVAPFETAGSFETTQTFETAQTFDIANIPLFRAFGGGGQDGFEDPGTVDNPDGYNDPAPVGNGQILLLVLCIAYFAWKATTKTRKTINCK